MAIQFNAEYLKNAGEKTAIRKLKEDSYSLMNLRKGMKALDIGCGPGIDTLKMAKIVGDKGMVYGVDADRYMVDAANREMIAAGYDTFVFHQEAVSASLPFASNYFDATRCERVLQHLNAGEAKVTVLEAVRVTKPGGNIVFVDTDWASLSIHCNNPDLERRIAGIACMSISNGFAARGLPELFQMSGVELTGFETRVLLLSFSDIRSLIEPMVLKFVKAGWFSQFDLDSFTGSLNDLDKKRVLYSSLNMVMCYGRKIN